MGKTILVVDDDATDVNKIVMILEKEGYEVMKALSADEAFQKAQETPPDLVITDVVLSGVTGFDVCRKIKETFQPHPPFVLMITGKAEGVNVSLAHKMGADGFEAKTSDMAHVVKTVRKILSQNNNRAAKADL